MLHEYLKQGFRMKSNIYRKEKSGDGRVYGLHLSKPCLEAKFTTEVEEQQRGGGARVTIYSIEKKD